MNSAAPIIAKASLRRTILAAIIIRALFTMWMAGGGIKPGATIGQTDDFGYNTVEGGTHVHDIQATLLHLLGIDHERLTYQFQGRRYRLTDVYGKLIDGIMA